LERKTAALLAYVALEKDATRTRVAALLWPSAAAATARNNLAQVVARLKKIAGRPVVGGKDLLSLDRVSVDVVELELAVQRGRIAEHGASGHDGLLAGFDFSDCPELAEWIDWRRDQLRRTLLRALELEERRLEAERDFAGAIERAEQALRLDRWGEVTWRRLMRLHVARGDRARALDVFAECERVLREELQTSPSRDTLALAERLRRRSSSPAAGGDDRAPSLRYDLPPFVGRARSWALAENACEAGRVVFVSGEPGIGKSRFVLELAHARGSYVAVEGRPGDGTVAFSTLARSLRLLLRSGIPSLRGWARRELSRILPELSQDSAPLEADTDRLRLFEAVVETFRRAAESTRTFVFDDLQFADAASVEAFAHLLARLRQEQTSANALITFRRGELTATSREWVERTLEAGHAVQLDLAGLDASAIWQLAEALSPDAKSRIPDLERASLGNPLFIAELLRHSSSVDAAAPRVTPRIERLLERRLERLSPGALRLARVASLLGSDLDVELAASVMDARPLELDEPWAELEREQVLSNRRFVHDLLAETLEKSLSRALSAYLHQRVARELVARNGNPATIARHFELAEDALAAAPFMLRAAERLRTLSRLDEAAGTFERAAEIFAEHGDTRAAIGAWFAAGRFLPAIDRGERFQRLVSRMAAHVTNDAERARALVVRAFHDESHDDLDSAVRHATEALELASRLGHAVPRADALRILFATCLRQGKLDAAEHALEEFREMCRASGQPEAEIAASWHGAELLAAGDRHLEAIELQRRASAIAEHSGTLEYARVALQGQVAHSALALGRTREAEEVLASSSAASDLPPMFRLRVELCHARVDMARGRLSSAALRLGALLGAVPDGLWEARVRALRGALSCWLGATSLGRNELLIVIDDARTDLATRVDAMLALARSNAGALPSEQRIFIEQKGSPLQRLSLLELGRGANRGEIERALASAEALGARGHAIALSLQLAHSIAQSGDRSTARALAETAWLEARDDPPPFPELARVALARAELVAGSGADATEAWRDALAVVDAVELPPERIESHARENEVVARIRRNVSREHH
jgi:DNA-binding SARP family transcriptional activator